MRKNFEPQIELGATPIESIPLNPKSRDDIPQLLYGLQFIYKNTELRKQVFDILREGIGQDVSFNNGRPGMDLWVLLVLGIVRLGANCDYDRLHELANEHRTLRAMLGHGSFSVDQYSLQAIKDNVHLLTEEMLTKINALVVDAGHRLVKKKEDEALELRCDSFVVETNVEYPTDIGLLFDAMRKVMELTARLSLCVGIKGWRQSQNNLKKLRSCVRKAQQSKRSRKKDAQQKQVEAHKALIQVAGEYLERSLLSLGEIESLSSTWAPEQWCQYQEKIGEIRAYQAHAMRQVDQIERRVVQEEVIPSDEKCYSIFEPHTEWISKGKAGVPVELGLKVCVVEDQYQFICHHRVMEKEQDVDVAIPVIDACREQFGTVASCSFDRGFHSPANQTALAERLDEVVLPKKGKMTEEEKTRGATPSYRQKRKQHSAVESAINALEHSGLDRCSDKGIEGFRRYVSLGVLARNLQRMGSIVQEREADTKQLSKKLLDLAA